GVGDDMGGSAALIRFVNPTSIGDGKAIYTGLQMQVFCQKSRDSRELRVVQKLRHELMLINLLGIN
ncbi:MAG: hypothetical protein ACYCY3_09880, partial [Halothiobacillus sp.]